MGLFDRLLGLDQPEGAYLHSATLALRGGMSGWVVAALMFGVIAVAWGLYSRESHELGLRRRLTLAALRGAALALLVGLLARPVLITESRGERPRGVVLLVDNSASFQQVDRRASARDEARVAMAKGQIPPTANPESTEWQSTGRDGEFNISRADVVRSVLQNARIALLEKLQLKGPVRSYLFGSRPRRVDTVGLAKAITADEDRTAIADAILEIAAGKDGDPPASIVLVTDGLDNGSKGGLDEAAAKCAKLGIAVHIYGVGSTDGGVVRLADAAIPEMIFYDDAAVIPFRYRARGVRQGKAIVTVTLAGKEVARKEVALTGAAEGRDSISFTPEKKAQLDANGELVVSIKLKDDPGAGDEVKKPVTLSERKVRVLVIDDAPRWEFKFLQPALSRDRRVEATYLVAQGDPRALKNEPFIATFPTRDQLFKYDAIILGDVSPSFLGVENVQALQDFTREGGGLAVIAGRKNMPAAFADSPLAEVLPVEFVPIKFPSLDEARPSPFQPELTAAGRRSELVNLGDSADDNEKIWKDLPGLFWHYPTTKLRPGATTLVAHPKRLSDDTPMPLIATQYYGKGQVLFLAIDETWRWRFNEGDRLFARFWGQVVYQLGLPHLLGHGKRVLLALERADAIAGRPGYVYARMFDAEYKPFVTERIPAVLESLNAPAGADRSKPVVLDPVPGRPGEYRAMLPHDSPGRFEFKVNQPEAGSLAYRVQLPPGHELEPNALAEAPMIELARATNGRFYREEDLLNLPGNLMPKAAPFTVRQEVLLWNPLALLVFVALVTAEWIVRKLAHLS